MLLCSSVDRIGRVQSSRASYTHASASLSSFLRLFLVMKSGSEEASVAWLSERHRTRVFVVHPQDARGETVVHAGVCILALLRSHRLNPLKKKRRTGTSASHRPRPCASCIVESVHITTRTHNVPTQDSASLIAHLHKLGHLAGRWQWYSSRKLEKRLVERT